MSKKARAIFLSVNFTVFVLSAGIGIMLINKAYYETIHDTVYRIYDLRLFKAFTYFLYIPVLINELSWIRSTYKLLKYGPSGIKRVFYIISTVLSFCSVVFFWLVLSGCFLSVNDSSWLDFILYAFLLLGWPVVIVSFILGSIPVRKRKGAGGASIGDAPPADPAAETRPENSDTE